MPNNPVKEGQIFVGWFTDNTYLTFYDFNELVTTDLTLHGGFEHRSQGGPVSQMLSRGEPHLTK